MRIAVIREEDCVGCTKCLAPCPVDAIVGAAKFQHTVLTSECIGCELCVAPCPMDCIEMISLPIEETQELRKQKALKAKQRYQAKQTRLMKEKPLQLTFNPADPSVKIKIQHHIQEAILRVEKRRRESNRLVGEPCPPL